MSSEWLLSANQTVGVDRLGDLANFFSVEAKSSVSPIDAFYAETKELVSFSQPDIISQNKWIGCACVVTIVSNTENYFREILSAILKYCPESQKKAVSNNINFGSVIWHTKEDMERGALENISLASSENIKNTVNKFLGINIGDNNLKDIFKEFDKVCELRHGIVHSGRVLAGKNGLKLNVKPISEIMKINVDYARLQEIVSVCNTLVVACNQFLFNQMVKRWAVDWRKESTWTSSKETEMFKNIWNTFHSKEDESSGLIPVNITWVKCRNLVKKEFNL